jgi:hypothetical protein
MKLARRWNAFVKSLAATKNAWDSLAELMNQRPDTDKMPHPVQKMMSFATVKRGARFDVAMPRLLDHFRKRGGIEKYIIPTPKPEKPKGEKTDDRSKPGAK